MPQRDTGTKVPRWDLRLSRRRILAATLPDVWINSVVTNVLASPLHRLLSRRVIALRIVGRTTRRSFVVPVQFAREEDDELVVFPARFDHKTWWRNLHDPTPIEVLYRGVWRPASGRVVPASADDDYLAALSSYHRVFPHVIVPPTAPLVLIELHPLPVDGTIDPALPARQGLD